MLLAVTTKNGDMGMRGDVGEVGNISEMQLQNDGCALRHASFAALRTQAQGEEKWFVALRKDLSLSKGRSRRTHSADPARQPLLLHAPSSPHPPPSPSSP